MQCALQRTWVVTRQGSRRYSVYRAGLSPGIGQLERRQADLARGAVHIKSA